MYGRLGYYHYIASTQVRLARENEARAKAAVGAAAVVTAKPDRHTSHICWICVAAIAGSIGVATGYALMVEV